MNSNVPSEIIAEYQLRCDALVQRTGCTKSAAAVSIAKSHPALHEKYLSAVNGRPIASAPAPAAPSAADVNAIDAEVDKRIEAVMRGRTMPRSKAIAMVFSRDPVLHSKYLSAHNGGRPIGRP